jgi:hypothetical protein
MELYNLLAKLAAFAVILFILLLGLWAIPNYLSSTVKPDYSKPVETPGPINGSKILEYKDHEVDFDRSNPEFRSLQTILRGQEYSLEYPVYSELDSYLSNRSKDVFIVNSIGDPLPQEQTEKIVSKRLLDEPNSLEQLRFLARTIQNFTSNKDDQARIAISLAQRIPYDSAKASAAEKIRLYPYQVLYHSSGVCEEKGRLLAILLRELGFGSVIFSFEQEAHLAVGIKCPMQYGYRGTGYCFVETTGPTIITDDFSNYPGFGKLSSAPLILPVSDGASFNSVTEEASDLVEWRRIAEIASSSPDHSLVDSDYRKWLELKNKYGLVSKSS